MRVSGCKKQEKCEFESSVDLRMARTDGLDGL